MYWFFGTVYLFGIFMSAFFFYYEGTFEDEFDESGKVWANAVVWPVYLIGKILMFNIEAVCIWVKEYALEWRKRNGKG